MPTTRRTVKRYLRRRISRHALDLFDSMMKLEQSASCELACSTTNPDCVACKQYWDHHDKLHDELRLTSWQWPAFSSFENDKPDAMERFKALKAASDADKRAAK